MKEMALLLTNSVLISPNFRRVVVWDDSVDEGFLVQVSVGSEEGDNGGKRKREREGRRNSRSARAFPSFSTQACCPLFRFVPALLEHSIDLLTLSQRAPRSKESKISLPFARSKAHGDSSREPDVRLAFSPPFFFLPSLPAREIETERQNSPDTLHLPPRVLVESSSPSCEL